MSNSKTLFVTLLDDSKMKFEVTRKTLGIDILDQVNNNNNNNNNNCIQFICRFVIFATTTIITITITINYFRSVAGIVLFSVSQCICYKLSFS